MSLGKLLGAGKSFVNGGKAAAYRADRRIYLPKFASAKNPFASAAQTESSQPRAENPAAPVKKTIMPMHTWKKTQKMPTISATPKSLAAWTSKLNPLTMLRSPQPAGQAFQPTVQSELSLDSVKVVHNDLSDAEVEVVPMKSRPGAPVLQPAVKTWEVLGERIFGTNAT
jgi:hypothetical protein